MNKYIIGVLVVALAGIVFYYGVIADNKTKEKEPIVSVVTANVTSHDFGDIDILGGNVETTYTLKNEGEQDVSIISAITSCMCTEGVIDDLRFGMHGSTGGIVVVPAGGEKILTAIFDPLAHGPEGTGKITRELLIKTDSVKTPEIKVKFTGNVVKNEESM